MSKYMLYYAGYDRSIDQEQIGVLISSDLRTWTRPESGPVLSLSFAGMDLLQTSNPCVIKKDGKYFVWFQGKLHNGTLAVFFAASTDGIVWKGEDHPVLALPQGQVGFRAGYQHPHVIYDEERSIYRMWFTLNKDKRSTIGYAESGDGIHWDIKSASVLQPEYSWEGCHVLYPMVLIDEQTGLYSLWYTGRSVTGKWSIGYATSRDGVTWKKNEEPILAHYVLPPFLRRIVEFGCKLLCTELKIPLSGIASANVWKEDGSYHLIAHEVGTHGRLYIPLYQSTDGVSWNKKKNDILESVPMEDWDAFFQADPFIFRHSGT